jgi:oligosaccharide 4-alpha-D-glucosyltransferase
MATVTGKNFTSKDKNISVLIHNIKAKGIFVNGQEQIYKTFQEPLQVNVTLTNGTTSEIKIEY